MSMKTSEEVNRRAHDAALAAVSGLSVQPTSLVSYESDGVVAVIGDARACKAASKMSSVLKPHLILSDDSNPAGNTCTRIRQRDVRVKGYLGNFIITLQGENSEEVDSVKADLVLDLSDTALLAMPMKPPGYIASAPTESDIQLAIDELSQMTGTFEKPKYFEYDSSICAHGRSGITACRRCIDVCPADAIKSLRESIEVDPNLCQGGGACASACPGGAIRYVYPSADDTLSLIRRLLKVYGDEGGSDAIVMFHAAETEMPDSYAGNVLPVIIEELASVGIEIWLSALAYGARTVLLLDDDRVPDQVRRELKRQLLTSTEILVGMGYSADAIRLIDSKKLVSVCPEMPEMKPAAFAGSGNKRQTAFMAIDVLYQQALTVVEKQTPPMVTLTAGAAFGEAIINASSCTLCMSCVSACPGKALQNGQDVPQVLFIESLCLQCGMCTCTCPEGAMSISPRILFDREARNHAAILHEEAPFCCVSCGKPFATQSVINNMMAKLEGHWMFTDERSKQRLKMCEDCRVIDVVQDPEMMEKDIGQGRVTH